MRKVLVVWVCVAMGAWGQVPESKPAVPEAHCHEFNGRIPTEVGGTMIELKDESGRKVAVYAAGDVKAKGQIILIHEWWGLNNHIKGMADQMGKIGYRAFAVDLYDGKTTDKREEAAALMEATGKRPEASLANLKAVLAHAKSENKDAKRGTVGWCFGGGWSLQTALAGGKDVHACVIYYGQLETDAAKLAGLAAPVLGIFAKKDAWITPEMVQGFEAAMKKAGKRLISENYDADHAFANPSQTRFDEPAAKDAWAKTLDFFRKSLE